VLCADVVSSCGNSGRAHLQIGLGLSVKEIALGIDEARDGM